MIERRNNDGNYEPGNCCWATRAEQNRNTRHNRFLEVKGTRMTITDAARIHGIALSTLRKRLSKGVPAEHALGLQDLGGCGPEVVSDLTAEA
jgi:hypothetical protein